MEGVISTKVGYAGGTTPDPTYRAIGDHAETVQVVFDPGIITYEDLLMEFFEAHDPFSPSYSRQYASMLFVHDEDQKQAAQSAVKQTEQKSGRTVVTEILPYTAFYQAEDYHQKYVLKRHGPIYEEMRSIYPAEQDMTDSTAAARINGFLAGWGSQDHFERTLPLLGLSEKSRKRLEAVFYSHR